MSAALQDVAGKAFDYVIIGKINDLWTTTQNLISV